MTKIYQFIAWLTLNYIFADTKFSGDSCSRTLKVSDANQIPSLWITNCESYGPWLRHRRWKVCAWAWDCQDCWYFCPAWPSPLPQSWVLVTGSPPSASPPRGRAASSPSSTRTRHTPSALTTTLPHHGVQPGSIPTPRSSLIGQLFQKWKLRVLLFSFVAYFLLLQVGWL